MKALAPRTIVGDRYEILSLAGEGGMGQVYRARHLGLGKEVALKVLGARVVADAGARFEREARAIARLDHPGCVRILDHGRTGDGARYIAMELLAGETLAAALSARRFSPLRSVHVARQLLAALAHAHRHGVLHRDVKPANVMLVTGDAPRTVLIDFGLACLRDEASLTAAGLCLGSPSYIAPERLCGAPPDARADVYAVGVILYEMLAGTRPFTGGSPEAIIRQALHRPPRPLRAIRPDVSRALADVVRRALAKHPERRFADAEDMLSALADVPVHDRRAERALAEAHAEEATTAALAVLALHRPGPWSRLWSWLRYGGWRWARTG